MLETYLYALPRHVMFFAGVLALLLLAFLIFFLAPAFQLGARLIWLNFKLGRAKQDRDIDLSRFFGAKGLLAHLWKEYSDTLHDQTDVNVKTGRRETVKRWSTVPAETIFRPDVIVDTGLRSEFFKHLPGIFTGVGIIGTFYGLILGLSAFQVSENAVAVRNSLNSLLHGVWEAFLVSASAITLAMGVTVIEKLVITWLYGQVTKLTQHIDGMFESGAGEKYLARLVQASESSAAQTSLLKDALVTDLRSILTELTDRQIAAANASTAALSKTIESSLESGLRGPLTSIAESVSGVRADQGQAVHAMLNNVLTAFSEQLKTLFGDQISGINSMQQKTIAALEGAVAKFNEMASNVEAAGQRGAGAMADKLTESMAMAESRQQAMTEQMATFMTQMRDSLESARSESATHTQQAVQTLAAQMAELLKGISDQARHSSQVHTTQQERLAAQSSETIAKFGGQLEDVLSGVAKSTAAMEGCIEAMRQITTTAAGRMESAAHTLASGATDFANAGKQVGDTLNRTGALADKLSIAGDGLASASSTLGALLQDYQQTRDGLREMVGSLEGIVEQARREASLTKEIVSQIEESAEKLLGAEQEAQHFLEQVVQVIGDSHEAFSSAMVKALGETNREFQRNLSESVSLLREGIQHLSDTLEDALED